MRFKFLTGDVNWQEYGGSFISKKLNNGEFDYWLIMEVINFSEYGDEFDYTYGVELSAVSPSEASGSLKSAAQSYGWTEEELLGYGELAVIECLASYGCKALLWQDTGDNLKVLIKECHRQADLSNLLFGFYMDRYQNRIGSTGWDLIRGDLFAGLNRLEDSEE